MRVVDQAGFDAITCGRCGQCCERIGISNDNDSDDIGGPLGLLVRHLRAEAAGREDRMFIPIPFMEFTGQLVPRWDEEWKRYVYTCGHFSRDEDGMGICGIYEQRPSMCSTFPNERVVRQYDKCDWNVELVEYEVAQ